MNLKIPPCNKCHYHLGEVQTLENPCPDCKASGFKNRKQNQVLKKGRSSDKK